MRIIPNTQFDIGDVVDIKIKASTTSPYIKEISAEFQLIIGKEKVSYEIVDSPKMPYLDLDITNTLSYYTVSQSFGSFEVGNRISRDTYFGLSDMDKQKCYSALITLQFDPKFILLDMTNENYINSTQVTKTSKDSYDYINGITFRIDANTGTRVRFYKTDITKDYTYPNAGGTQPIITVTTI